MSKIIGKGFFSEVSLLKGGENVVKTPTYLSNLLFGKPVYETLTKAIAAHAAYLPIPPTEIIETKYGRGMKQAFIDGKILTLEDLFYDEALRLEFQKICEQGMKMQQETNFYFDLLGRNSVKKQMFQLFRTVLDSGYIPKNLDFSNFIVNKEHKICCIDIGTVKTTDLMFTPLLPICNKVHLSLIDILSRVSAG